MEDDVEAEIVDVPVTLPGPESSEAQEVYTQEGLDDILSRSNGEYTAEWVDYAAKMQKQREATPEKKKTATKRPRKKRCPAGQRRNRKTGECEPKAPPPKTTDEVVEEVVDEAEPAAVPEVVSEEIVEETVSPLIEKSDLSAAVENEEIGPSSLYPTLDDPDFNIKLTEKREFFDTKFHGEVVDVEKQADILCNAKIELAPYQVFVRNFLSNQTPYNGLLLYHGLGTGKTCSAITISEEYRDYMRQMGISKRIIVVGGKTIQDNYKVQLFNSDNLVLVGGLWTIKTGCIGNKLLKEVNPMNTRDISKAKLVKQINRIIHASYWFVGYREFGNMIHRKLQKFEKESNEATRAKLTARAMEREFGSRLIIIDEVHNVRLTDETSGDAKVAQRLMELTNYTSVKFLLLSATPMFNTHREIIWLLNLLNNNDNRPTMNIRDVFDKEGDFRKNAEGIETGKQMLIRRATGYVSFVKGENPYTFPYRIYPSSFAPEHTLQALGSYPRYQLNGLKIESPIQHLDVYMVSMPDNTYQKEIYNRSMVTIVDKYSRLTQDELEQGVGYQVLNIPIQILNMTYPSLEDPVQIKSTFGKEGLRHTMDFDEGDLGKRNFSYKHAVVDKFGEIFSPENIGNYSLKIKAITDAIMQSTGIVIVYSQYIDAGVIPVALALESLGFTRYSKDGNVSLFKEPPVPPIDAITFKPAEKGKTFHPAQYALITGDKGLSRDNIQEVKALTRDNNKDGSIVKIAIISKAASEGMDLKNVRQIHIADPWYNMNRNEQIIGRGIRFRSHCDLPFSERNAEIYMYATYDGDEHETADLYLYRLAELKAVNIGKVSRVLKKTATDCLLNKEQALFSVESMNQTIKQKLSTGQVIEYPVGDKPYTAQCDYMAKCTYECEPTKDITLKDTTMDTYNDSFIILNTEIIIQKIKELFAINYAYTKSELFNAVNMVRKYPSVQINAALTQMVDDNSELLTDRFGRQGFLVNVEGYYLFQPYELTDKHISMYDREIPLDYKQKNVQIELPKEIEEPTGPDADDETPESGAEGDMAATMVSAMEREYTTATTTFITEKITKNWYNVAGEVMQRIAANEGIAVEELFDYVVDHQIEVLKYKECLALLNYLHGKQAAGLSDYENKLWRYFEDMIIDAGRFKSILLWDNTKIVVMVLGEDGVWEKAKWTTIRDLEKEIDKNVIESSKLATVVGAIVPFTSRNDERVFKYVDTARHGGKGARCTQMGRTKCLEILGLFVDKEKKAIEDIIGVDKETPPARKRRSPRKRGVCINPVFLCVDIELYLRYYNTVKHPVGDNHDVRWFLHPIEALASKVPK